MAIIHNFVPRTGRGRFDFEYDGGLFCFVTVKIAPLFENVYSQKIKWNEASQMKFKLGAEVAIANKWTKADHKLVNRYLNPIKTVRPHFRVQFTAQADASVIMNVPRYASAYGPGNLAICNSYVGLQQLDSGNPQAQAKAMVHSETTHPVDIKALEGPAVTKDERKRLETLVKGFGLEEIPIGDALPKPLEVKLANFVNKVTLGTPSRPMIPLMLLLPLNAGPRERAFRNLVELRLGAFNIQNPILTGERAGITADSLTVTLAANDGDDFNADLWLDIFAHEYGHMIGLPDEYDNPPPPTAASSKDIAIRRFLEMTNAYGVSPPDMGKMTTSLMCKGGDVLRCHMVTVLQAMHTLTADDHWVIA